MIFEIYADGACSGNPGRGGWAALIRTPDGIREIVGFDANTTNNRMELQAAIEGLRTLPPTVPATVISDSEYLIKGMTQWLMGWKNRNWRTAAKKPVENRDQWEALDALDGGRVNWRWVRGHSGDLNNERVNALAQRETRGSRLASEVGASVVVASSNASNGESGNSPAEFQCYLSLVNEIPARHSTWESCNSRTHGRRAKTKKCYSLDEVQNVLLSWNLPLDLPEEWQGASAALPTAVAVPTVAATPRSPISRIVARGILDHVQSRLKCSGFLTQHDNGKDIAFHLVCGTAHAIGYTTGRLLAQGIWTQNINDWDTLEKEEENWFRAVLDSAIQRLTHFPFSWSPEIWKYLFIHLSAGSIRDWSAEPIGQHLLIRETGTNRSVGVLSPRTWQRFTPEDVDRISRSLHDCRWHEGARTCIGIHQDQQSNLVAVSIRLSPKVCSLASLWDWKAVGDAEAKEQHRIARQIWPLLELEYRYKRWAESEWRQDAIGVGNQVDVLVEWTRQIFTPKLTPASTTWASPLEIIGKLGGSEECAARLLEQRSAGMLKFRSPLLPEEYEALAMARFLAKSQKDPIHD